MTVVGRMLIVTKGLRKRGVCYRFGEGKQISLAGLTANRGVNKGSISRTDRRITENI